ncbi:MAG: beta-1,3-glucanase family protein [Smithella sp.]|nr:beta-1,3-glucanase family protein [Smithella sp.]
MNTLKQIFQRIIAISFTIIFIILAGCSSSSTDGKMEAGDYIFNVRSSNGLNVTIVNNSGRTAYVKFTGNSLRIDKNDVSINSDNSADFTLRSVSAGRIYISYDKALSSSAPDGANPADPDYQTRFDKVELTYGDGGKANLTAVDFYAIPMTLETSIEDTIIEHLTLSDGQTGTGLEAALTGIILNTDSAIIKGGTSGTETIRILSPVKSPGAYHPFDDYLHALTGATLKISGTFYGNPTEPYDYQGSITADAILLGNGTRNIKITRTSLMADAADLINHNGIYTCNGAYTVNGTTHHVADNDIYAAVYRDLITAFNLGLVQSGANDSATWWQSTPFQGTYNQYAKVIADHYPGAYGFPFTDRYSHILADLGGRIDKMTITLLDDNTSPPNPTQQGIINPQTGIVTFNLILITTDPNFQRTTFEFNTKIFTGGNEYTFPSTTSERKTDRGLSAIIRNIPAQEGLNIYKLLLRGKTYSVIMKIDDGRISWGSITGGANANWGAPNLFVGGLD